jgi:hypothetical protein
MSAALVVARGQEQSGRSGAAGGRQDRDSFGIAFRGSVLSIGYLARLDLPGRRQVDIPLPTL